MEQRDRIIALLDRYTANRCTQEERDELFLLIASGEAGEALDEHVLDKLETPEVPGSNLSSWQSEALVHRIMIANRESETLIRKVSRRQRLLRVTAAAAAAVLVIIATAWLLTARQEGRAGQQPDLAEAAFTPADIDLRRENNTSKAMMVLLEDGSRVTLQPGAVLLQKKAYNRQTREVILQGEAFFDVTGSAAKPFIVYHGKLVTRVLGTSFYIRNNGNDRNVEVEVTKGKVAVYENVKDPVKHRKDNGVIVTPNQKVVYSREERLFSTSLVDNPMPLYADTANNDAAASLPARYCFQETTLLEIFNRLQQDYGIGIELESKDLGNCRFSGDLSHMQLYQLMDVICEAISADYEIKGTHLLIKGQGCSTAPAH